MNIENELEKLKRISPQQVPDQLAGRIRSRIAAMNDIVVPLNWKWAFTAAAVLVLALNIAIVIRQSGESRTDNMVEMIHGMNLSSSNELYHE